MLTRLHYIICVCLFQKEKLSLYVKDRGQSLVHILTGNCDFLLVIIGSLCSLAQHTFWVKSRYLCQHTRSLLWCSLLTACETSIARNADECQPVQAESCPEAEIGCAAWWENCFTCMSLRIWLTGCQGQYSAKSHGEPFVLLTGMCNGGENISRC